MADPTRAAAPIAEDDDGKIVVKGVGPDAGEALDVTPNGKDEAASRFQAALDALAPSPGDDGRIDVGKAVAEFERGLGRTLTPDEYGLVGDRVMEAVLLESLNAEYEEVPPPEGAEGAVGIEGVEGAGNGGEKGTPGLSDLVDAVGAEHPDWGTEQIKAEVLTRVKTTEADGAADA